MPASKWSEIKRRKGALPRKRYEVVVEPDGASWLVSVPEIGRVTQALKRDHVDAMARDLIALLTGEDPYSFGVDVIERQ
jgi:hypothetical protein